MVTPTYFLALRIMDRIVKWLERSKYIMIIWNCSEWKIEAIIEIIMNTKTYVCLPHRPILYDVEQSMTKIRSFFYCLQQNKGAFSLNKTAYLGISLMWDFLKMPLLLRFNKYVMLEDNRKAFLRIRFSSDEDKNCFYLFWRTGIKYFDIGFVPLHFGLNYVLKHFAMSYLRLSLLVCLTISFMWAIW